MSGNIFPSLINADLLNLQHVLNLLDPYAPGYHLDVMDNHFVPNLTWGHQFINRIAHATPRPVDVHLMIDNPASFLTRLQLPPHSTVIFHIESTSEPRLAINHIIENNWRPGIAISPKTDLNELFPFLDTLHHVLVMSVEPGFSGQQFLPVSLARARSLVAYRQTHQLTYTIGMDGGINQHNIQDVYATGIDRVACATAIFSHHDPVSALQQLQQLIAHTKTA